MHQPVAHPSSLLRSSCFPLNPTIFFDTRYGTGAGYTIPEARSRDSASVSPGMDEVCSLESWREPGTQKSTS